MGDLTPTTRLHLSRAIAARDAINAYIAVIQNGTLPGHPRAAAAEWRVARACADFACADTFEEWREWTANDACLDPATGADIVEAVIAQHEMADRRRDYRAAAL